jgi:hypothetical protein
LRPKTVRSLSEEPVLVDDGGLLHHPNDLFAHKKALSLRRKVLLVDGNDSFLRKKALRRLKKDPLGMTEVLLPGKEALLVDWKVIHLEKKDLRPDTKARFNETNALSTDKTSLFIDTKARLIDMTLLRGRRAVRSSDSGQRRSRRET